MASGTSAVPMGNANAADQSRLILAIIEKSPIRVDYALMTHLLTTKSLLAQWAIAHAQSLRDGEEETLG
jgi:hypothetical protein